jgi:Pyridoxamine 5'-phosphate oxidase
MEWSELVRRQPRLAALAERRLIDPGVVLVATIRRDGTPRLSPVEPLVADGRLWLSMMWGSRKAGDLHRDPRVLVHSVITSRDGGEGELKVRGLVRVWTDPQTQGHYAETVARALGWRPEPGRFHLFSVNMAQVTFIRYDADTGDQHVASWPPAREFVRRGTTATTVGAPEPESGLLTTE